MTTTQGGGPRDPNTGASLGDSDRGTEQSASWLEAIAGETIEVGAVSYCALSDMEHHLNAGQRSLALQLADTVGTSLAARSGERTPIDEFDVDYIVPLLLVIGEDEAAASFVRRSGLGSATFDELQATNLTSMEIARALRSRVFHDFMQGGAVDDAVSEFVQVPQHTCCREALHVSLLQAIQLRHEPEVERLATELADATVGRTEIVPPVEAILPTRFDWWAAGLLGLAARSGLTVPTGLGQVSTLGSDGARGDA